MPSSPSDFWESWELFTDLREVLREGRRRRGEGERQGGREGRGGGRERGEGRGRKEGGREEV